MSVPEHLVCALQAEEGEQEEPQQPKRQPLPLPDKVPLALPQPPQAVSGAGLGCWGRLSVLGVGLLLRVQAVKLACPNCTVLEESVLDK